MNFFKNVSAKVSEGKNKNTKVIDIFVEEKPTGEITAGAGIGTSGGSFMIGISENNWLGEGKKLDFYIFGKIHSCLTNQALKMMPLNLKYFYDLV